MQSPPQLLEHRPPGPPICRDAVLCGADEVPEERPVEICEVKVLLRIRSVAVLLDAPVLGGGVCVGWEEGRIVVVADVEASAAGSVSVLMLLDCPVTPTPTPTPTPTAIAIASKAAHRTMKKVRLFRPRILALFAAPASPSQAAPLWSL
jgi:hypothetical protein